MKTFLLRFGSLLYCVLSGLDRLRLRGESRSLNMPAASHRPHELVSNMPARYPRRHADRISSGSWAQEMHDARTPATESSAIVERNGGISIMKQQ